MDSYKEHYRIVSVTSSATRTSLRKLVDAVYTAKSQTPPRGKVFWVRLDPSAAIEVSDAYLEDARTISSVTEFEVMDALDNLYIENVATVFVEIKYAE